MPRARNLSKYSPAAELLWTALAALRPPQLVESLSYTFLPPRILDAARTDGLVSHGLPRTLFVLLDPVFKFAALTGCVSRIACFANSTSIAATCVLLTLQFRCLISRILNPSTFRQIAALLVPTQPSFIRRSFNLIPVYTFSYPCYTFRTHLFGIFEASKLGWLYNTVCNTEVLLTSV